MGVPTSEVGYIFTTTRREAHEVQRTCGGIGVGDIIAIKAMHFLNYNY
jgi:hypothetical protein